MQRWSLVFLALAAVTALVGGFGVAGYQREDVRTLWMVFLLLPIAVLGFVAFRKSFAFGSQSAVRAFMFVILLYFVAALLF